MNKSAARLTIGLLLLAGLCLGYAPRYFTYKPTLEECIKRLNSDDFYTVRKAQRDICDFGKPAIPRLRQSVLNSSNAFEGQICCYLIGDIDAGAYGTILVDVAQHLRTEIPMHYPNRKAMASLSTTERKNLVADINSLHLAASDDLNWLERFITQPQDYLLGNRFYTQ